MGSKGDLLPTKDAAKKADISMNTLKSYKENGHLEYVDIDGYEFVYYRDVLRAAWKAKQIQIRNGKIASYRKHGKDTSEL